MNARPATAFVAIVALIATLPLGLAHAAETDPLPSWNDGPAKRAIVGFVNETTRNGSAKFVPPAERIATFGLARTYVYFMHEDEALGAKFAATLGESWRRLKAK